MIDMQLAHGQRGDDPGCHPAVQGGEVVPVSGHFGRHMGIRSSGTWSSHWSMCTRCGMEDCNQRSEKASAFSPLCAAVAT